MKRKIVFSLILLVLTALLSGCGKKAEIKMPDPEPKTSQMKAICELVVMDCYYHNVAKFSQEDVKRFLFWTFDKNFWIEYGSVVRFGVDVSQLEVEVKGTEVTITMPEAKVLDCKVDPNTLQEYIDSKSAKIDVFDETTALNASQEKLLQEASSDRVLISRATERAKSLLEDYVNNIGEAAGKEYSVRFRVHSAGNQDNSGSFRDRDGSGEAGDQNGSGGESD